MPGVSPELRHMRYFVAVAEELSYTRAAARLNVVQQTLSAAIQQLERELGVQLLIRDSHKVELTAAGSGLLDDCRRALETVERSWERARHTGRPETQELRIAHSMSVGLRTVPVLHAAAVERLAGVCLTWRETWSPELVRSVAEGRDHAGLARHPERLPQLAYEIVAEEPQVLAVSARHALAGRAAVALADLARETHLMFRREIAPGFHDAVLGMCRDAGFEPRVLTAPDTSVVGLKPSILERGEVVAVLPLSVAELWCAASDGLVLVPFEEGVPPLPLHLCWNPRTATPAVEAFVALTRELGRDGALAPQPANR
jgi:DNA-binding transcriptional LysR family regulator